jgi:hypothetical protein
MSNQVLQNPQYIVRTPTSNTLVNNNYQTTTNSNYMWTTKMELILKIIRKEANVLSEYHNYKYDLYKSRLRYFRIPIIILSAINAFTAVGLQGYLAQELISIINAIVSLVCGIITSIELFLNVQKKMENELISHKDYYHLNLDIFKTITLEPDKRNIDGKSFLDDKFSEFQKLLQNSNAIEPALMPNLNRIEEEIRKLDSITAEALNNNCNETISSISSKKENIQHPPSPDKRNSLQMVIDGFTNKKVSMESLSHSSREYKSPIQKIGKFVGDSCNQIVNPKYANLVKSRETTDASYGELIQSFSNKDFLYSDIEKKASSDSFSTNRINSTHLKKSSSSDSDNENSLDNKRKTVSKRQLSIIHEEPAFKKGDDVLVKSESSDKYNQGIINNIRDDGTYDIYYSIDDTIETCVEVKDIKPSGNFVITMEDEYSRDV